MPHVPSCYQLTDLALQLCLRRYRGHSPFRFQILIVGTIQRKDACQIPVVNAEQGGFLRRSRKVQRLISNDIKYILTGTVPYTVYLYDNDCSTCDRALCSSANTDEVTVWSCSTAITSTSHRKSDRGMFQGDELRIMR